MYVLELKRYFQCAEDAAREVLLEDYKRKKKAPPLDPNAPLPDGSFNSFTDQSYNRSNSSGSCSADDGKLTIDVDAALSAGSNPETDSVYQLTTLSALPLKSPKRMIALQLAQGNPLFRYLLAFFGTSLSL